MAESIDETVTREILSSLARGHVFIAGAFQSEIGKRIRAAIDEAVLDEREACAKVAENYDWGATRVANEVAKSIRKEIAKSIRNRWASKP